MEKEIVGERSMYGERNGAYRVLMGKPEGKRPLGRSRRKWEENIKLDVQEMRCWCINVVMNLRVP